MTSPTLCIAVLAHNEARRIAACLRSLPEGWPNCTIHVIVNGSTDDTAAIARGLNMPNTFVHDYTQGGKSRSWNRFVFDTLETFADVHVFVDGDAEVVAGSIEALTAALSTNPHANLASAVPANGRHAARYAAQMLREGGVFGDLYAVRGSFLARMKAAGVRLPDDLIGDDGLIGALAKTDLASEDAWDDRRVAVCLGAGFLCEPTRLTSMYTLRGQYRRMINYSVRHFQNQIISHIMRGAGPTGLPSLLNTLYADWLPHFRPRRGTSWWFDREALKRMKNATRGERGWR